MQQHNIKEQVYATLIAGTALVYQPTL